MDGVITKQSEEYIRMMEMLKKCSKEIFAIQDLPVPVANEVYMTGEQVCGMLHISSRTLQKLRDEKGIAYTAIGGKFLYPLSKLQL
ncbi:helix-turn-helix domain-containing protein, partial [Bacteroides uniformis]